MKMTRLKTYVNFGILQKSSFHLRNDCKFVDLNLLIFFQDFGMFILVHFKFNYEFYYTDFFLDNNIQSRIYRFFVTKVIIEFTKTMVSFTSFVA